MSDRPRRQMRDQVMQALAHHPWLIVPLGLGLFATVWYGVYCLAVGMT